MATFFLIKLLPGPRSSTLLLVFWSSCLQRSFTVTFFGSFLWSNLTIGHFYEQLCRGIFHVVVVQRPYSSPENPNPFTVGCSPGCFGTELLWFIQFHLMHSCQHFNAAHQPHIDSLSILSNFIQTAHRNCYCNPYDLHNVISVFAIWSSSSMNLQCISDASPAIWSPVPSYHPVCCHPFYLFAFPPIHPSSDHLSSDHLLLQSSMHAEFGAIFNHEYSAISTERSWLQIPFFTTSLPVRKNRDNKIEVLIGDTAILDYFRANEAGCTFSLLGKFLLDSKT